jgi:hypothetical protein
MKSVIERLKRFKGPHDTSYGLEYNTVKTVRRVSSDVYSFDLARTPHVVLNWKDDEKINVQGKAYRANGLRKYLDQTYNKAMGRQ